MKTAIVPAQITSVEDTIAGSLTLTQLILLIIPVFLAAFLLTVLPPMLKVNTYKLVMVLLLGLPFLILSLRINDQILFHALKDFVAFTRRPRLYLATRFSETCQMCTAKLIIDKDIRPDFNLEDRSANKILPLSLAERSQLSQGMTVHRLAFISDKNGNIDAVIE